MKLSELDLGGNVIHVILGCSTFVCDHYLYFKLSHTYAKCCTDTVFQHTMVQAGSILISNICITQNCAK